MVWFQFCETIHNKYLHETETAVERDEMQIQSLPAGGAVAVPGFLLNFNMLYALYRDKMKRTNSI